MELEALVHTLRLEMEERSGSRDEEIARLQLDLTSARDDTRAEHRNVLAAVEREKQIRVDLQEQLHRANDDVSTYKAELVALQEELSGVRSRLHLEEREKQELQNTLMNTGEKVDAMHVAFQNKCADFAADIAQLEVEKNLLQEALDASRRQTDVAEDEVLEARQETRALQEERDEMTASLLELQGLLEESNTSLGEKEEELSALKLQLAELEVDCDVSHQKISSLDHELAVQRDSLTELQGTLDSARDEVASATESYVSASQECETIKNRLDSLTADYEGKCVEVENLRESLSQLEELQELQARDLQESRARVEALEVEVEECSQEKQYLAKRLTRRSEELDDLTQEHQDLQVKSEELSTAAENLELRLQESEKEIEEATREKDQFTKELTEKQQQYDDLWKANQHLETLYHRIQEDERAWSEERERLGNTINALEKEIDETRAENAQLAEKVEEFTEQTASRDRARTDHFAEMEASLASSKNTVSEWRAECARLLSLANEERHAKEAAMADSEQLGYALMEARNSLEQCKIGLMVEIEELKEENLRLQSNQSAQWQSEARVVDEEQLRDLEARLQRKSSEVAHAHQQLEQLRNHLSQYEEEKVALTDELSQAEEALRRADRRAHEAEVELREMMIAAGDERGHAEREVKALQLQLEEVERAAGDEQLSLKQHINELTSRLGNGSTASTGPPADVLLALRRCCEDIRTVASEVTPFIGQAWSEPLSPDAGVDRCLDEIRSGLTLLTKAYQELQDSRSALSDASPGAETAQLIEDLRREVADSSEMMEFQRKKIESLKQTKKQLLDEMDQLRDIAESAGDGDIVRLLQKDLSQAKSRISTLSSSLEKLEEENVKLLGELSRRGDTNSIEGSGLPPEGNGKREVDTTELVEENEVLKADNDMLSKRLRKLESARGELNQQVQQLQGRIAELEGADDDNKQSGADIESLKMNITRLQSQLNASKKHEGSQLMRLHELTTSNKALLEKNKMLEEAAESAVLTAEMQFEELKELRERLQRGTTEGSADDKFVIRDLHNRCKILTGGGNDVSSFLY